MHLHTSNRERERERERERALQRALFHVYGKVSKREGKSSKWLHRVRSSDGNDHWCYFTAGIDVAMLETVEKCTKEEVRFGGWISFKIWSS